ncbi:Uncharacterised protein [Actinomadura madurae]|nr:Uncharacterised protein [Actinomadura madurae]
MAAGAGEYEDFPFVALVLYINREVVHHEAGIALLRDLYLQSRARSGWARPGVTVVMR